MLDFVLITLLMTVVFYGAPRAEKPAVHAIRRFDGGRSPISAAKSVKA